MANARSTELGGAIASGIGLICIVAGGWIWYQGERTTGIVAVIAGIAALRAAHALLAQRLSARRQP